MLRVTILTVLLYLVVCQQCIDKCETIVKEVICTNIGTLPSPVNHDCYFVCNVTLVHPGTCGCPNDCLASLQHGVCNQDKCVCNSSWRGRDCGLPKCPENSCSGRGKCVQNDCVCDRGFTGFDCSSVIPESFFNPLPFGILAPGEAYYSSRDEYKDDHPLLTKSVIPTISISVNNEDFLSCIHPFTVYDHDWIKANMTLSLNGVITYIPEIGLRVKGKTSRKHAQKNWVISFDKYVKKRKIFGLDRIGLKYPMLTNFEYALSMDLWRSMGTRVQRNTFSNVFINDVHYGIMWTAEELVDQFLKNYYENAKGNLYKMERAPLLPIGQGTGEDYRRANRGWAHGRFRYNYELETNRPGTFQDLAEFIAKLNKTNDREFENIFDMDRYIRSQVVELCITQADGYTISNNNYKIYHDESRWDFLPFDPQHAFLDIKELAPGIKDWSEINPYLFGFVQIIQMRNPVYPAPLTQRMIRLHRSKYTYWFKLFLEKIWTKEFGVLHARVRDYSRYLFPQIQRDMWQMSFKKRTIDQTNARINEIYTYITNRHQSAINHLDKE
jgi:hypothetical protein